MIQTQHEHINKQEKETEREQEQIIEKQQQVNNGLTIKEAPINEDKLEEKTEENASNEAATETDVNLLETQSEKQINKANNSNSTEIANDTSSDSITNNIFSSETTPNTNLINSNLQHQHQQPHHISQQLPQHQTNGDDKTIVFIKSHTTLNVVDNLRYYYECYCSSGIEMPQSIMIVCSVCKKQYHLKCVPSARHVDILPGEMAYTFECSRCGPERFEKKTKTWNEIIRVAIYNLVLRSNGHTKFFHQRNEICEFMDKHQSRLCDRKTRTVTQQNTVVSQLSQNRHIFRGIGDGHQTLQAPQSQLLKRPMQKSKSCTPNLNSSTNSKVKKHKPMPTKQQQKQFNNRNAAVNANASNAARMAAGRASIYNANARNMLPYSASNTHGYLAYNHKNAMLSAVNWQRYGLGAFRSNQNKLYQSYFNTKNPYASTALYNPAAVALAHTQQQLEGKSLNDKRVSVSSTDETQSQNKGKEEISNNQQTSASVNNDLTETQTQSQSQSESESDIDESSIVDTETKNLICARDSLLIKCDINDIINKETWSLLTDEQKEKLLQFLPEIDRDANKIDSSLFNNSHFKSSLSLYQKMLESGDFDPDLAEIRSVKMCKINKQTRDVQKEQNYEEFQGDALARTLKCREKKVARKNRHKNKKHKARNTLSQPTSNKTPNTDSISSKNTASASAFKLWNYFQQQNNMQQYLLHQQQIQNQNVQKQQQRFGVNLSQQLKQTSKKHSKYIPPPPPAQASSPPLPPPSSKDTSQKTLDEIKLQSDESNKMSIADDDMFKLDDDTMLHNENNHNSNQNSILEKEEKGNLMPNEHQNVSKEDEKNLNLSPTNTKIHEKESQILEETPEEEEQDQEDQEEEDDVLSLSKELDEEPK